MDMKLSKLQEIVEDSGAWHAAVYVVAKSRTQLSNQITTAVKSDTQDCPSGDAIKGFQNQASHTFLRNENSFLGLNKPEGPLK